MVKSVPCQNCSVKRSLSMKGEENSIQIDFYIPLPYITYLIDSCPISKSPAFFS
jgi:hypothetical protein